MKYVLPLIIILILPITFLSFINQNKNNYLIIKKKGVVVKGGTTLGSFNCSNDIYKVDTIYFYQYKNNSRMSFKIKVADINCGNKLLNKDVYKTLKTEEYPLINVSLFEFKNFNDYYTASIDVNIVGRNLKYKDVILSKKTNNIAGSVRLKLTQVGLEIPQKLGGLVKMKDEVVIHFNLSQ